MRQLERHHHFKPADIRTDDRLSRVEAEVVTILLDSKVPDDQRDSSIAWELKHQAGVLQLGRVLASKRSLNTELAATGALLHDIYTIISGSYEDHAHRGGPIALDLLDRIGTYSNSELTVIESIIVNHSDKHLLSEDPYIEFGKDADILDCFLYPDALDEYLLTKPPAKVVHYLKRAKAVWSELGMPQPLGFVALDRYSPDGWLTCAVELPLADYIASVQIPRIDGPAAYVASRTDDATVRILCTPQDMNFFRTRHTSNHPSVQPPTEILNIQCGNPLLVWRCVDKYEPLTIQRAETLAIDLTEAI